MLGGGPATGPATGPSHGTQPRALPLSLSAYCAAAAHRSAQRHLDVGLGSQLLLVRVQAHLQAGDGLELGVRLGEG